MRILLAVAALFTCISLGHGQEMFSQEEIQAREIAAATGQPYELCLKALHVVAWCQANPQGGVVNGKTYDAQATAMQLAEAQKFLQPKPGAPPVAPAAPAPAATPAPSVSGFTSAPVGSGGLSNRPAVAVGRSANDPERMAEQRARQQRQNDYQAQGLNGVGRVRSIRFVIPGAFRGFSGSEVYSFYGETWKQIDNVVTHHNPPIMNPTATLTVNAAGTYGVMELSGVPGSVLLQFIR